ncbi:EAL domain-containing protein [Alicyclobacillus macrosporangiidus]|uniref:EAL domain, c-di-GMP-specific phosphodiesterase class I (Or its enzymatically inactive variant) n=1 Tax=Alicyclobacillus macrosporangiidus TaxID=392015 RepID=A0A1I7LFI2_9BACL|nr:EAL domain-containing protein [Alicyclobacillus macrosporangiidus]SFV08431.1 EAL domain, c-di-GMP-specific phosphodiesterase class I (or its enzymatically inactive variant) [Alicyclobacillus macrosporangiidus]
MALRQQVIVRLSDETVFGHELLLAHPRETLGLLADAGLLTGLDRYILDVAAQRAKNSDELVFVNVTSELLTERRLPFPPDEDLTGLVLEITERSRLDAEAVVLYLAPFRERGLKVALDDFGDGFNGISRWSVLRPDFVKVRLTEGVEVFLPMLVQVAAESGAQLVVERVETPEQHAWLQKLGVGYGQGFYYGRPTPIEGGAA